MSRFDGRPLRIRWKDGVWQVAIFAISDLHLSFNKPTGLFDVDHEKDVYKPMDVFGWERHYEKIRDAWLETVGEADTVLIPGDISWGMKLEEARHDFEWISQLPGRKVMSPGNHCYYAQSKKKVRQALPEGMEWIDADYTVVEGVAVAGTRGWILPGDRYWDEERDRKIYERQVGRLRLALEAAARNCPDLPRVAMLHFPPVTRKITASGFLEVMKEFDVQTCVYGHLHGEAHKESVEGEFEGIYLQLVSCDYLNFRPVPLHLEAASAR